MADKMKNKLTNRITIRLTDHQMGMFKLLQKTVLPDSNKSQILRTIMETLYANAKNAGYLKY